MGEFFTPELLTFQALAAFVTLTVLEVVLGIDNIVVIAIVTGRLPEERRPAARRIGLSLAMLMRIAMLLGIAWIITLTEPIVTAFGHEFSWKDFIMIGGGLFLLAKATKELHATVEGVDHEASARGAPSFMSAITQIILLDAVFSIDSVLTAIGMTDLLLIMIAAIVVAIGVMLVFAGAISGFIERHPTTKVLALAFLLLIGVLLVAEGLGQHVPRGYVYFALTFSLGVEALNIRARMKRQRKAEGEAATAPARG